MSEKVHISVCICTFRRPALLRRLLEALVTQETGGAFTYSIVVVDNDSAESAKTVVDGARLEVKYYLEARQNIALARNKAVQNTAGEYVAFIDDDEVPVSDWLLRLLRTLREYHADGVLGTVKPHFDILAPQWVIKGRFYDRPPYPTGMVLGWAKCRTGNVLIARRVFADADPPFRPEFISGEDQDFFQRMIAKGHVFVGCEEAVVYEAVPPSRWKRGFLIKRALQRGFFSLRNRRSSLRPIFESLVAVPLYAAALPFALALGQARFMSYVFKLSYFLGRLFAVIGLNPLKQSYVDE